MRTETLIILFFLFPLFVTGQLYKCDSTYHNADFTIRKKYKNGLKHGYWEYRSENNPNKIIKVEEYWFDELVRTDTSAIYKSKMFSTNDTIIEYPFTRTILHVLSKRFNKIEPEYFYYCELDGNDNGNYDLIFYKVKRTDKQKEIDKFLSLTNRYIVLDKIRIPILLDIDRKFANLGWVFTGYEYMIKIDNKQRILEINK